MAPPSHPPPLTSFFSTLERSKRARLDVVARENMVKNGRSSHPSFPPCRLLRPMMTGNVHLVRPSAPIATVGTCSDGMLSTPPIQHTLRPFSYVALDISWLGFLLFGFHASALFFAPSLLLPPSSSFVFSVLLPSLRSLLQSDCFSQRETLCVYKAITAPAYSEPSPPRCRVSRRL